MTQTHNWAIKLIHTKKCIKRRRCRLVAAVSQGAATPLATHYLQHFRTHNSARLVWRVPHVDRAAPEHSISVCWLLGRCISCCCIPPNEAMHFNCCSLATFSYTPPLSLSLPSLTLFLFVLNACNSICRTFSMPNMRT